MAALCFAFIYIYKYQVPKKASSLELCLAQGHFLVLELFYRSNSQTLWSFPLPILWAKQPTAAWTEREEESL